MTVQKLLDRSKWSLVHLPRRRDQTKTRSKLCVKRSRVVTNHLEATASNWSFRPECTDNDVAAELYGVNHLTNISPTVGCCSQKVKDSAIMPNVVGIRLQFSLRDVRDKPMNPLRCTPQPLLAGR